MSRGPVTRPASRDRRVDDEALAFIILAKKSTYAAGGDTATVPAVLVPGSKQLEFARGRWLYRDIYTGFRFLAGQETVYRNGKPIWAMVYCGGVSESVGLDEAYEVYRFLREALRQVDVTAPYRGPESFSDATYEYSNDSYGSPARFRGREVIRRGGTKVYELDYCGGLLA